MSYKIRVLHLEDIATDAELVFLELKRSKIEFERLLVDNKVDYEAALNNYVPDIVLSDHSLPSFNSTEALKLLKASSLNIPFILITSTISEEFAVEIMKDGATDYILKDRMQRLPNAVLNAIEKYKVAAERERANYELNLLFNTIDDVYFSRDTTTDKLIQISPACEKIYGYSPAEFLANLSLWTQVIHPDDRHFYQESFEKLRRGEQAFLEYRIIHKDERLRWVESKIIPELNHNGVLVRLYGVTQDITERKRNEEALALQHIKLLEASEIQAGILNALSSGVVLLNNNTKIIAINEAWRQFTLLNNLGMPNYGVGYNYLAIVEKATGIDKVDGQRLSLGIREVIAGNTKEFRLEYFYNSPIGKRWFQIIIAPLADQSQQGAVVLHIDITDKKLAEESLVQSESNLRSIFENTDLAIVLFDQDLKIVSYNTNASRLAVTHFRKKLKQGSSAYNYFHKDRKMLVKQVVDKVKNKESVFYETNYDIDGIAFWYEVKWTGILNRKDENIGVVLTLKNITEKKNADIHREKITADLVRRNMDLEQFTYIISHNLRAPVANIIGLSNMIDDLDISNKETASVLKALSSSIKSLDDVILDLNHILQVNSHVNQNLECISFENLMEEIKNSIGDSIEKENATFICDFNATPSILTLKSYLHSILYNLIVNSIKYRQPGISPVITIGTAAKEQWIEIVYNDNGRGINLEKNAQHLFGLYKRFDYSVEGKGMGLFMVKAQVENLGGTIGVASQVDKGTTFTINLPLQSC